MNHVIILYDSLWFLKNEGTFFKRITTQLPICSVILEYLPIIAYVGIGGWTLDSFGGGAGAGDQKMGSH